MNFDLRPHAYTGSEEGQIPEGWERGALVQDDFENCTFACLAATMIDYGCGDPLEPESMRQLVTPGWHGGESWQASIDLINARRDLYPCAPEMGTLLPEDVVGLIRDYGSRGCMVHVGMWCTPQAEYTAGDSNDGISHAARCIAADDGGLTVWNPWYGALQYLTNDFVRAAYDEGGVLVFYRSLLQENNLSVVLDRDPNDPADAHGLGAVYVSDGIWKRYLGSNEESAFWRNVLNPAGKNIVVPGVHIDRVEEVETIPIGESESAADLSVIEKIVAAAKTNLDNLSGHLAPADIQDIAVAVAARVPAADQAAIAKAVADELEHRLAG